MYDRFKKDGDKRDDIPETFFMGKKYWTEDRPIYSLIRTLVDNHKLNPEIELCIFDDNQSIINLLINKLEL